MFRLLFERGADVRSRDRAGSTTLLWAAFNETGKTELVEQMLTVGVDPIESARLPTWRRSMDLRRGLQLGRHGAEP